MHQNQEDSRSWLKFAAIIIYFGLYAYLFISGSDKDVNVNYDDPSFVNVLKLLQVFIAILLFVVPAILFAALWTPQKIRYLGMHVKPGPAVLLVASVGMVLAVPLIDWLTSINMSVQFPDYLKGLETWVMKMEAEGREATEALTRGTTVGSLLANLFVVAFMAALSEEMFFRGVVQKVAIECFRNKHVAIWIGAFLFSACHLQFYGFLPRLFMGAYLGYLFYWSKSLWPGILAHFLNNGLIVYLTWLNNRGDVNINVEQVSLGENQTLYIVLSIILVIASLYITYRLGKKRDDQDLHTSVQ
jgi:membrane protease YdiL (CAAX protease family)